MDGRNDRERDEYLMGLVCGALAGWLFFDWLGWIDEPDTFEHEPEPVGLGSAHAHDP